MKFSRELPVGVTVRRVTASEIHIGDTTWTQSVKITSAGVIDGWAETPISSLGIADFESLLSSAPELVILGTGTGHVIPPRELVFALARRGIGFESMHTRAAARTFNVLVGEGRQVAAVLYL